MGNSEKTGNGAGIGFSGVLTILFIALKLLNKIDWPWIWVLSPIWITAIIAIVFLIVFLFIYTRS